MCMMCTMYNNAKDGIYTMSNVVRKNISINRDEYLKISEYAKKHGISFSEFISKTALSFIENSEEMSLLDYLNNNVSFVDIDEQKEIDGLKIDYSKTNGKDFNLDELLQD